MSEEQQTAAPDSILDNDMTDVSPDAPLIPKNRYIMEVVKVEQLHSDKKNSDYINIQLKSVEPITAVTGEVLQAGRVNLFGIISITPSANKTVDDIQRSKKQFMVCMGQPTGKFTPLDQWVGKRGKVTIGFAKKTDEYPDDKNSVKSFDKP